VEFIESFLFFYSFGLDSLLKPKNLLKKLSFFLIVLSFGDEISSYSFSLDSSVIIVVTVVKT
jgi:hypothetical protein